MDVPSLPHRSAGRTILIGDASHAVAPHSGQGDSMALGDAMFLDGNNLEWPVDQNLFSSRNYTQMRGRTPVKAVEAIRIDAARRGLRKRGIELLRLLRTSLSRDLLASRVVAWRLVS
jgi:hypothetical protein